MQLLGMLVIGWFVGMARGGRLTALMEHRWHAGIVPFIALLMQVVAFLPDESTPGLGRVSAAVLHVLSYLLLLAFVWLNRQTPWMWLLGVGLVLNAVAIIAHGGFMPVVPGAMSNDYGRRLAEVGTYNNVAILQGRTVLWFLGDIFRTPSWLGFTRSFSMGDLLIGIGAALAVQRLMLSSRVPPRGGAACVAPTPPGK